jgi:hypothetical protein
MNSALPFHHNPYDVLMASSFHYDLDESVMAVASSSDESPLEDKYSPESSSGPSSFSSSDNLRLGDGSGSGNGNGNGIGNGDNSNDKAKGKSPRKTGLNPQARAYVPQISDLARLVRDSEPLEPVTNLSARLEAPEFAPEFADEEGYLNYYTTTPDGTPVLVRCHHRPPRQILSRHRTAERKWVPAPPATFSTSKFGAVGEMLDQSWPRPIVRPDLRTELECLAPGAPPYIWGPEVEVEVEAEPSRLHDFWHEGMRYFDTFGL